MTEDELVKLKIVVLVIGGKGGIGKSITAQIIANKFREIYNSVMMVDTDHTNNSTKSIEPDARMLDIWDVTARGALSVLIEDIRDGRIAAAVIDSGAQEDSPLLEVMGWLAREAAKAQIVLVAVLPLTLSSHNQRKAVEFAVIAEKLRMPLVYINNLGQGRSRQDFEARWGKSRSRAAAIASGAVETELRDAGARFADEAAGYGLSLADAALGRFEKAGDKAEEAAASFDRNERSWLNIYLEEAGDDIVAALVEAIIKRRQLSRPRGG